MRHFFAIQTAASLIVLSVIALAEVAALLLAKFPSSVFLWYLNQHIFSFMEIARRSPVTPDRLLITQATLYWVLGLALVLVLVYRVRWRFGAAVISHICMIFVGLLTYAWAAAVCVPKSLSIEPVIAALGRTNSSVLMFAIAAALLSAVFAHLTYFAGIFPNWIDRNHDRVTHSHRVGGDPDICNS
ncbi:MAG: hypothetical protein L0Y50_09390 [Beijerinckiaceae bacterium]|nr:hypothetical protein [Beijerinckiaceae bacterium]MCI0736468.1 hypothetical protein [Beijerinckiaceae bacterium]